MSSHWIWKRDGVVGVYMVEVEEGDPYTDERVRIRPLYHTWAPSLEQQHRARWVSRYRLRAPNDYDRAVLADLQRAPIHTESGNV